MTERANLPVASNVANTAVSLHAKSELAQNDDSVISKPQIVTPTSGDRTVQTYTAKSGDTVKSVAAQYNLNEDTVKWANNLSDENLTDGQKLTILPTDGIMHKVVDGESVKELAAKYKSSEARITSYNDLELSTPQPGTTIIIPSGVMPAVDTVEPVTATNPRQSNAGGAYGQGGGAVGSPRVNASAGNRYAPGNCTWYAYERRVQFGRPVGSFWGNANTWGISARAAGYAVDGTPEVGAVLVDMTGYYGHVGVVEKVKSNGDIEISEMNNLAYGGFNVVNTRSISAGQAAAYQYIH